jgi:hypothetical protein
MLFLPDHPGVIEVRHELYRTKEWLRKERPQSDNAEHNGRSEHSGLSGYPPLTVFPFEFRIPAPDVPALYSCFKALSMTAKSWAMVISVSSPMFEMRKVVPLILP